MAIDQIYMDNQELQAAKELWKQNSATLTVRKPRRVLNYIWIVPVLTGFLVLASRQERLVTITSTFLAVIYIAYSLFTYRVWTTWPKKSNNEEASSGAYSLGIQQHGSGLPFFNFPHLFEHCSPLAPTTLGSLDNYYIFLPLWHLGIIYLVQWT